MLGWHEKFRFPLSGCRVNIVLTVFFFVGSLCCSVCPVEASARQSVVGVDDQRLLSELSAATTPCAALSAEFNLLNSHIRDNRVDKRSAQVEVVRLLREIRGEYIRSGARDYPVSSWVFPVSGYDAKAAGGGRRHGFVARGYDFFSGNRHGGHPSFDIFIRDRNRDTLDDRSGKAVPVLSMTGGVVVALEQEWQHGSRLRGGRYVWVYDPANNLLVYYAHNSDLTVTLGQIVKPGDMLATVGRSGWNAAKKRSPTHLHLTVLQVTDGRVTPLNVYRDMARAARGVVTAAL